MNTDPFIRECWEKGKLLSATNGHSVELSAWCYYQIMTKASKIVLDKFDGDSAEYEKLDKEEKQEIMAQVIRILMNQDDINKLMNGKIKLH